MRPYWLLGVSVLLMVFAIGALSTHTNKLLKSYLPHLADGTLQYQVGGAGLLLGLLAFFATFFWISCNDPKSRTRK